jgi:hypothetical protein
MKSATSAKVKLVILHAQFGDGNACNEKILGDLRGEFRCIFKKWGSKDRSMISDDLESSLTVLGVMISMQPRVKKLRSQLRGGTGSCQGVSTIDASRAFKVCTNGKTAKHMNHIVVDYGRRCYDDMIGPGPTILRDMCEGYCESYDE